MEHGKQQLRKFPLTSSLLVKPASRLRRWFCNRSAPLKYSPNAGCEVDLDENVREKAQHTQKYVSIFPTHFRSKAPTDSVSGAELLPGFTFPSTPLIELMIKSGDQLWSDKNDN